MSGQPLGYTTLDVFTGTRSQGNQLAIVHVPSHVNLPESTKQAIAQEFNFSETVFLHDATKETATKARQQGELHKDSFDDAASPPGALMAAPRRVDIFMPTGEIPFAGHPVIGAIYHVCSEEQQQSVNLNIKAGLLAGAYDPDTGFATADVPHNVHLHRTAVPPMVLFQQQPAVRHHIAGQESEYEYAGGYPVVSVTPGMTYVLIQLPDLKTLQLLDTAYAAPEQAGISIDDGWLPTFIGAYYFVITGRDHAASAYEIRSRMVCQGVGEDACTGSAACTLAAYLAIQATANAHEHTYLITQGVEMGRSGHIKVQVTTKQHDNSGQEVQIERMALSGQAVPSAKGVLFW